MVKNKIFIRVSFGFNLRARFGFDLFNASVEPRRQPDSQAIDLGRQAVYPLPRVKAADTEIGKRFPICSRASHYPYRIWTILLILRILAALFFN